MMIALLVISVVSMAFVITLSVWDKLVPALKRIAWDDPMDAMPVLGPRSRGFSVNHEPVEIVIEIDEIEFIEDTTQDELNPFGEWVSEKGTHEEVRLVYGDENNLPCLDTMETNVYYCETLS